MLKFIFKWLFRLVLLVVVLAVVFLLSLDAIVRVTIQHQIRAQTGMDVEIGRFHFGLLEPVVSIEGLKIHNPPAFGGTPFLTIPEIHVEYDQSAFKRGEIHITLLRFNVSELDIVRNAAGQTNLFAFGLALPAREKGLPAKSRGGAEFKQRTGLNFKGIDVLNVSIGTAKYIDLKDPQNNREQKIAIENLVMTKTKEKDYAVTSRADLAGLALLIDLRSNNFFKPFFGSDNSGAEYSVQDILKLLGH